MAPHKFWALAQFLTRNSKLSDVNLKKKRKPHQSNSFFIILRCLYNQHSPFNFLYFGVNFDSYSYELQMNGKTIFPAIAGLKHKQFKLHISKNLLPFFRPLSWQIMYVRILHLTYSINWQWRLWMNEWMRYAVSVFSINSTKMREKSIVWFGHVRPTECIVWPIYFQSISPSQITFIWNRFSWLYVWYVRRFCIIREKFKILMQSKLSSSAVQCTYLSSSVCFHFSSFFLVRHTLFIHVYVSVENTLQIIEQCELFPLTVARHIISKRSNHFIPPRFLFPACLN